MTDMKTCKDFCDHLSDYLEGRVNDFECRLIEDHLDACPPCALVYEALKKTVRVCSLGISAELPDQTRTRLRVFLREHCRRY